MILRLYWKIIPNDFCKVRVVIADQPFEDGRIAGELTLHMREFVKLNAMDFQTEYHEEGNPNTTIGYPGGRFENP